MTAEEGTGDRFQRMTRFSRRREPREPHGVTRQPPLYKRYRQAAALELEQPLNTGGHRVWDVMHARRSVRHYTNQPLTRAELAQLLWATQGITAGSGRQALRVAPSAGALYPLETYVVVHAVAGVEPGVYHYNVEAHRLERLQLGDFRQPLQRAALDQDVVGRAAVVFAWSAIFDRCKYQYGQRAYRYIYLDAGHVGQNLALAAVGLGLASCPVAAFYDDEVDAIIGVDGVAESGIYMTAVGRTRQG
jgi:SagB-type dehydrogenase family enzyme